MGKGVAKIGVSNLRFAKIADTGLIDGDILEQPGTTEAKLDVTTEMATLMADDGPYIIVPAGITKAELGINNYDIDSKAKALIYNLAVVNGIELYDKDLFPNDVAVSYQTKLTNNKKVYVGMLQGKFSLPGMNVKTLGDGSPDPETDEITGSFVAKKIGDKNLVLVIGRSDDPDFKLAEFEKMVFPKTEEDLVLPTQTAKA